MMASSQGEDADIPMDKNSLEIHVEEFVAL